MPTTATERYVRLTILVFEGGAWICKKILFREVAKTKQSLSALLQAQTHKLKIKLTKKQYFVLTGTIIDEDRIDDWDVPLFVKVITLLFKYSLPGHVKSDLEEILAIRNEVICHRGQPHIDEHVFSVSWKRLTDSFDSLLSQLDESDSEHMSRVVKDLESGPLDLQSSIIKLAKICRNDEHMDYILDTVSRIEQVQHRLASGVATANSKLDEVLEQLGGLAKAHDNRQVDIPSLECYVRIKCKTKDNEELVEKVLEQVIDTAIHTQEVDRTDTAAVACAVRKFLKELDSKGAPAVSVTKGSILLYIQCISLQGLYNLLKFCQDGLYKSFYLEIEAALNGLLKEDAEVEFVFPEHSVGRISNWLDETFHSPKLILSIQCQSLESVSQVSDYFRYGTAASRFDKLSTALSAYVNDSVQLDATLTSSDFSIKDILPDESKESDSLPQPPDSKSRNPILQRSPFPSPEPVNVLPDCNDDDKKRESERFYSTCNEYLCEDLVAIRKRNLEEAHVLPGKHKTPYAESSKLFLRSDSENITAKHMNDINVATETDNICWINGLLILPDTRLALTDTCNKKVTIIGSGDGQVLNEIVLSSCPWAVALLRNNIAVTMPEEKKILLLNVDGALKIWGEIEVDYECRGIAAVDDNVVVSYRNPPKIEMIAEDGSVVRTIVTEYEGRGLFKTPDNIAISRDLTSIYVSDWYTNNVTRLSLNGDVMAIYIDDDLIAPHGVCVDHNGFVYVCDEGHNKIMMLTHDFKKVKILLDESDGLVLPATVQYCESTNMLYVGICLNKVIKMFKLLR